MNQRNRHMKAWIYVGLLTVIFQPVGCILDLKKDSFYSEMNSLQTGYEMLRQENYSKASEIFEMLSHKAHTDSIRHEALYAFACTRMILAENTDQFREAYDLWNIWNEVVPRKIFGEDPRLLKPFFKKIASGEQILFTSQEPDYSGSDETESAIQVIEVKNSSESKLVAEPKESDKHSGSSASAALAEKVRKELQNKDKEIQQLKDRIGKMKKEIGLLRSQITSLEEIHQEIQEKKKGMIFP